MKGGAAANCTTITVAMVRDIFLNSSSIGIRKVQESLGIPFVGINKESGPPFMETPCILPIFKIEGLGSRV